MCCNYMRVYCNGKKIRSVGDIYKTDLKKFGCDISKNDMSLEYIVSQIPKEIRESDENIIFEIEIVHKTKAKNRKVRAYKICPVLFVRDELEDLVPILINPGILTHRINPEDSITIMEIHPNIKSDYPLAQSPYLKHKAHEFLIEFLTNEKYAFNKHMKNPHIVLRGD